MQQSIERTVLPAYEPVTPAQAKLQARVTSSAEDALIQIMIQAAREEAEVYLRRTICLSTWRKYMDGFPACGEILLPYPKILSLSALQYRDQTGTWLDVDSAIYTTDFANNPGRICLNWDASWPTDIDYTATASVRAVYKAGYVDSGVEATVQAAVPAGVKQWVLIRVASLYANREAFVTGTVIQPVPGTLGLLDKHRVMHLGM